MRDILKKSMTLTRSEEKELFLDYREHGKKETQTALFNSNILFAYKVLLHYCHTKEEIEDYFSMACIGLLHAIDTYDVSQAETTRFISYAVHWIRHFITDEKNRDSTISVPILHVKKLHKIIKQNGNIPEDDDMLYHANMALNNCLSFDTPIDDDSELTIQDTLIDEVSSSYPAHLAGKEIRSKLIDVIYNNLSPLKSEILIRSYGLETGVPETLRCISENNNITHERIRQLKMEAQRDLVHIPVVKELLNALNDKEQ
jgi:RNA polymerase sigma factor (sigma-70 family)